jgi:hypothetical protein
VQTLPSSPASRFVSSTCPDILGSNCAPPPPNSQHSRRWLALPPLFSFRSCHPGSRIQSLACFNMWRSFRRCRPKLRRPLLHCSFPGPQAHLHAPAVGVALPAHRVLGCPTEGRCGLTPYSIGTRFEIRAVLRATGQITPTAAGQCINQVLLKRGIIRHARDRATITRACPPSALSGAITFSSPFHSLRDRPGWLGSCPFPWSLDFF